MKRQRCKQKLLPSNVAGRIFLLILSCRKESQRGMSYLTNFTVETGRTILCEIIKTVNQPENSKTISLAKASAGKEMIAMMQLVFPLVMKIQMDVITNFGFPGIDK